MNGSKAAMPARERFLIKVAVLERWASSGVPSECRNSVPRNVTELAAWHAPELGILAWRKPNVVSPRGPNSDLRRRFETAIAAIGRAGKAEPDSRAGMRERIRSLETERNRLAEQLVTLRFQMDSMEASKGLVESELAAAKRRQIELEGRLRGLVRFPTPVGGGRGTNGD
jgi:hypothetical protein